VVAICVMIGVNMVAVIRVVAIANARMAAQAVVVAHMGVAVVVVAYVAVAVIAASVIVAMAAV